VDKPNADERPQPMRWRLGSDDDGQTWRELAPGETARLVSFELGTLDDDDAAPDLAAAIDRAKLGAHLMASDR